ncbi:MAG TPA: protein kinase [Gemmatimonadaceae bacterium]
MSQLAVESERQLLSCLDEVLDAPAPERLAFARSRFGTDEDLVRDLARLLAEMDRPEGSCLAERVDVILEPVLADLSDHSVGAAGIPAVLVEALAPRYTVLQTLGRGGMASVYLAFDSTLGRHVAIKSLRPELADGIGLERFEREISIAATVDHPGIVPVYDRGKAGGLLFYVMRYVEGGSLRNLLHEQPQLEIRRAIDIARDVAEALDAAHAKKIVHRDIKPANILLDDNGAHVADFGVARLVDAAGREQLTRSGIALGTALYMSPEQAGSTANVDRRSDVYSLGCVVYEMLAGEAPFTGPTQRDIMAKHLAAAIPDLTVVRATVTRPMQQVIATALQKAPADRFASAGEFIDAFERAYRPNYGTAAPSAETGELGAAVRNSDPLPDEPRPRLTKEVAGEGTAIAHVDPTEHALVPRSGNAQTAAAAPALSRGPDAVRPVPRIGAWRRALIGAGIAGVFVGASVVAVYRDWAPPPDAAPAKSRHFTVMLPDTAPMVFVGTGTVGFDQHALAVSPDGSTLAYVAAVNGASMLYVRRLNSDRSEAVIGSEGAFAPTFSPDGQWVAYLSGTRLYRVHADGGQPVSLAEVPEPLAAAWLPNGWIVVSTTQGNAFASIRESGGAIVPMRAGRRMLSPGTLGRDWLLGAFGDGWIGMFPLADSMRMWVLPERGAIQRMSDLPLEERVRGVSPVFQLGSYLIFVRALETGVLMALPFDASRREVLGEPVAVQQGIRVDVGTGMGVGQYALAADGTLMYAPGGSELNVQLLLLDRRGRLDTLPFPRMRIARVQLSRDGRLLTGEVLRPGVPPRWVVLDLERGTQTPLPAYVIWAVPDADNRHILASRAVSPNHHLTERMTLAGVVRDTVVRNGIVTAVSDDGRVFVLMPQGGTGNLVMRRGAAADTVVRLGGNWLANYLVSLSPTGDWVAVSDEVAGKSQVLVVRSTDPSERYQISVNGGEEPLWSADGKSIVYHWRYAWYSVAVDVRDGFKFGAPRPLFKGQYVNFPGYSHALMPDGERHLLMRGSGRTTTTRVEVVTDWLSEVRRVAGRPQRR